MDFLTSVVAKVGLFDHSILFGLAAGLCLCLSLLQYAWRKHSRGGHRRKVKEAERVLRRLKGVSNPAGQFYLLRATDPYVFEEMILTAIKHFGYKIKRNKRYSGDGGIDGKCVIRGETVLIQAKRYKNHIRSQHVKHFAELCQQQGCKGLFVHTGKTGLGSRTIDEAAAHLEIISGVRMLNLLTLKHFRVDFS